MGGLESRLAKLEKAIGSTDELAERRLEVKTIRRLIEDRPDLVEEIRQATSGDEPDEDGLFVLPADLERKYKLAYAIASAEVVAER